LGRLKDVKTTARTTVLQSKQLGRRENKQINLEGRILFDLLLVNIFFYSF
jgi:DNA polymerase delta subunit 1